jgi:hypothetical protein
MLNHTPGLMGQSDLLHRHSKLLSVRIMKQYAYKMAALARSWPALIAFVVLAATLGNTDTAYL